VIEADHHMRVMTLHPAIANDARMNSQIGCDNAPLADPVAQLVDAMLARYIDWRESAAMVAEVHRRWREDRNGDCGQLHAAYQAALDREETAATAYEHAAWNVEHSLVPAD
jgi:hypothetical protein